MHSTYFSDSVTPKPVVNKVTAPFYLDMTIILPVAVSAIVILIVLIVVCFVVRKKHSSEHYGKLQNFKSMPFACVFNIWSIIYYHSDSHNRNLLTHTRFSSSQR